MDLETAKQNFIQTWGSLGAEWGVNRTMAQVHAALLVSETALSTDEVMERLKISRGNANTNLRALVQWGLVGKESRPGERKEYYAAEKDVWEISRTIAKERRRRELDPLMKHLSALLEVEASEDSDDASVEEFKALVSDILALGERASSMLDLVLRLDQNSFFKPLLKALMK